MRGGRPTTRSRAAWRRAGWRRSPARAGPRCRPRPTGMVSPSADRAHRRVAPVRRSSYQMPTYQSLITFRAIGPSRASLRIAMRSSRDPRPLARRDGIGPGRRAGRRHVVPAGRGRRASPRRSSSAMAGAVRLVAASNPVSPRPRGSRRRRRAWRGPGHVSASDRGRRHLEGRRRVQSGPARDRVADQPVISSLSRNISPTAVDQQRRRAGEGLGERRRGTRP